MSIPGWFLGIQKFLMREEGHSSTVRGLAALGILCLLSLLMFDAAALCGEEQLVYRPNLDDKELAPVNWKLLDFPQPERHVTMITIVLNKLSGGRFKGEEYLARDRDFVYRATDHRLLDIAEAALSKAPRNERSSLEGREFVPRAAACGMTVGHLVITTTRDEFRVGITNLGFALDSKIPRWQNLFRSRGLSALIDEIVFQQTGKHLPAELIRSLSPSAAKRSEGTNEQNSGRGQAIKEADNPTKPAAPPSGASGHVTRFIVAPDGSEVWCAMEHEPGWYDYSMAARVLHCREGRWEQVPDAKEGGQFYDAAFSSDGKKVWASYYSKKANAHLLKERTPGEWPWRPVRFDLHDEQIEKLRLTPDGGELWLINNGLFRVKLGTGKVSQYVESDFRAIDGFERHVLLGDSVSDLVFTADRAIALCLDAGITTIDLHSGASRDFPTGLDKWLERLVLTPDNRTAWCIFNHSYVWRFDIRAERWTQKLAREGPCWAPASAPDGQYLWAYWPKLCVYSAASERWREFPGEDWLSEVTSPPLCVTTDGKTVLCGHDRGLALFAIDGSRCEVLQPDAKAESCVVGQILPVPRTGDYVCSISYPGSDGLYRIDVKNRTLRKLSSLNGHPITALAIGRDGYIWAATPSGVCCVDSVTGKKRAVPPIST
jgi:hypothetical protein